VYFWRLLHPRLYLITIFSLYFLTISANEPPGHKLNTDSLIAFSKKHLGVKYKLGVCSPKSGFDCSSFVYFIFGHFDIQVPRTSITYQKTGDTVDPLDYRAGDILVFTGTNPKIRKPGHVGIIISCGSEDLKFIHCSSGAKKSGVVISSFKESPSYKKRLIKVVRMARN
jgi:murein DD-endopeptidase / murein LD-carboxypeptidase